MLHESQNTILFCDGSVSRWHVLHFAASIVLVDFLRLTPGVGSGITGTNVTGFCTFRPDLVLVGCGVYVSEASESSSSSSSYELSDAAL